MWELPKDLRGDLPLTPGTFLFCVLISAPALFVLLHALHVYYRWFWRKGFRSPALVTLLLFLPVTSWVTSLLFAASYPTNPALFATIVGVGTFMPNIVLQLAAVVWPRSSRRISGPRRGMGQHSWLVVAGLTALFAGVFVYVRLWRREQGATDWWTEVQVPIGILAVVPIIVSLYRRSRSMPLSDLLDADPRPPVLYVRAFADEDDQFAPQRGIWQGLTPVTFERFIGHEVSRIGPFIALGSPEDALPLEGAAREYADDHNWKDRFATLSDAAVCIVMKPSASLETCWEVSFLLEQKLFHKLFLLLPPLLDGGIFERTGHHGPTWIRRAKGLPRQGWDVVTQALNAAGLRILPAIPSDACIIAFDKDGAAEVLACGLQRASDYVATIERRLASLPSSMEPMLMRKHGQEVETQTTSAVDDSR